MKTKKIDKKLVLKKATIESLGKEEEKAVYGGFETNPLGLACYGDPWETYAGFTCDHLC